MVVKDQSRLRPTEVTFYAIAGLSLGASIVFILSNRLPGLGYFDGSEYAVHISGGGIAHAPGYPLYLILGKLIHAFGADAFFAQQVTSVLALGIAAAAIHRTFALEVGTSRPGFAAAFAITIASLSASYYLRLFSILPEVFLLNVGLFSLLILAITHYHHFPDARNLGAVFFLYGLGLCHHHTLAFTLPACLYLIIKKLRRADWLKSALLAMAGLFAGCLPLLYLFESSNRVESTYYRVHDLESLWFVLLRKGYGTFHLSPLASEPDVAGLYSLALEGLLRNFNILGVVAFAPLLI